MQKDWSKFFRFGAVSFFFYFVFPTWLLFFMPAHHLKQTRLFFLKKVKEKVGVRVLRHINSTLTFEDKELWGKFKPEGFEEVMILATLYKDLFTISYSELHWKINKELQLVKKSIERNVKVVRKKLHTWSKTVLVSSTKAQLEHVAKHCCCPPPTENVSLWVDSTDLKTIYKKEDPNWKKTKSYMENHAARRWVTLCDAAGITQWVSQPYYPTEYNSDLLIHNAREIEKIFPKITIIGDNHFRKA